MSNEPNNQQNDSINNVYELIANLVITSSTADRLQKVLDFVSSGKMRRFNYPKFIEFMTKHGLHLSLTPQPQQPTIK